MPRFNPNDGALAVIAVVVPARSRTSEPVAQNSGTRQRLAGRVRPQPVDAVVDLVAGSNGQYWICWFVAVNTLPRALSGPDTSQTCGHCI